MDTSEQRGMGAETVPGNDKKVERAVAGIQAKAGGGTNWKITG